MQTVFENTSDPDSPAGDARSLKRRHDTRTHNTALTASFRSYGVAKSPNSCHSFRHVTNQRRAQPAPRERLQGVRRSQEAHTYQRFTGRRTIGLRPVRDDGDLPVERLSASFDPQKQGARNQPARRSTCVLLSHVTEDQRGIGPLARGHGRTTPAIRRGSDASNNVSLNPGRNQPGHPRTEPLV